MFKEEVSTITPRRYFPASDRSRVMLRYMLLLNAGWSSRKKPLTIRTVLLAPQPFKILLRHLSVRESSIQVKCGGDIRNELFDLELGEHGVKACNNEAIKLVLQTESLLHESGGSASRQVLVSGLEENLGVVLLLDSSCCETSEEIGHGLLE